MPSLTRMGPSHGIQKASRHRKSNDLKENDLNKCIRRRLKKEEGPETAGAILARAMQSAHGTPANSTSYGVIGEQYLRALSTKPIVTRNHLPRAVNRVAILPGDGVSMGERFPG